MKKITINPALTTLGAIQENYMANPGLYESTHYDWLATRFDPFWGTLAYADNEHYKGWYMKCAIIDIEKESGIQHDYSTIWFDLKGRGDKTVVICQLGGGKIRFEIEGNIPKLLKGKEQQYIR